jgi:hypothetical protein
MRDAAAGAVVSVLLVLAACAPAGGDDLAWCEGPDGSQVIAHQGEGVWADEGQTPRLVELWRAGGLHEGESLAYPTGLAVGPDGSVAIPDFQLGEVAVIGPDGDWRGSVGGRGDGPGEIRTPVAAAWDEDGTLAVFDVVAPKVAFLASDGPRRDDLQIDPAFTAPVIATGEIHWAGVSADGTAYLQPGLRPSAEEGMARSVIVRLRPGATSADTVASADVPTLAGDGMGTMPAPGWSRPVAAVTADGLLVTGGADDRYRIEYRDADGRTVRVLCRDAAPDPLGDAETGRKVEGPHGDALRTAARPDRPAPFGRLVLSRDGGLWVQRARPDPTDGHAVLYGAAGGAHDIFDADGRFLGSVATPDRARIQGALGDRVWAFEVGDLDEVWVVAYRLEVR